MKHVSEVSNSLDNADFKYVRKINIPFTIDEIIARTYRQYLTEINGKIENL